MWAILIQLVTFFKHVSDDYALRGKDIWLVLSCDNKFLTFALVGTRDGRTQSARAWLFFFLHLDGLKTPIYTQTIVK
jgi:hypothetical protein